MNQDLKKQISLLAKIPGVYLFKDKEGNILYVGKANSLRDRVRSYLSKRLALERGLQMTEMIARATQVEIHKATHEIGALILEARLIRQHKPPYNIKLRDDKSFAVIAIDYNCDYPAITVKREIDLEKIAEKLGRERSEKISQKLAKVEYFGPYTSSNVVKQTLKTLRKAFRFCDCSPEKFRRYSKLGRGCFYYSLGQCSGPCLGKVTPKEYRQQIEPIRQFLKGNQTKVIRDLEVQMQKAIDEEEFEQAARIRDQIRALAKIQHAAYLATKAKFIAQAQSLSFRIEAYDISNISGQHAVGSMIVANLTDQGLEFAKHYYRRFKIKTVQEADDVGMMKEVLTRRVRRINPQATLDWQKPDLIVIDGGKGQYRAVQEILAQADLNLPLIAVAKGITRKKVDLFYKFNLLDLNQERLESEAKVKKIAEKLREEAHRFAISYYRIVHRRSLVGK